jgi:Fe-S-cluster containining protein
MPSGPQNAQPEWFATPDPDRQIDGDGLRFACTLCGNCCSGPSGYVVVSDAEAAALAARLSISVEAFIRDYTHATEHGRSLNEKVSPAGLDCVFLDRESIPGKAVCGVYEDRPIQCRTWPFWPSVVKSHKSWLSAKRVCPGMDKGPKHTLVQIRTARDAFNI